MTRVYSREEVRQIPIRARRALGGVVQGEAKTRMRGSQGLEFSDFREYEPGDDVARIDWNVTARLGKPWVRTYLADRGHPVLVMADISPSTHCGLGELPARNVIADVAARLACAAIWNGCETGLLLFADHVKKYLPASAGVAHLSGIVRELKRPANGNCAGLTNLASALDYVQSIRQRRSLVFLLSDFLCGDFADSLKRCAGRHEIVAIDVAEPEGMDEIPDCGLLNLRDPETGHFMQLDTGSGEVRKALGAMRRRQRESNVASFRQAGVDYLRLDAAPDYMTSVIGFLRQRAG